METQENDNFKVEEKEKELELPEREVNQDLICCFLSMLILSNCA